MGFKLNENGSGEEEDPLQFLKLVKAYSDFYNMPFNDVDKELITIFVLKSNFMKDQLKK